MEECYEDELNQSVIRRVENITGIPDGNSEYWQFLEYYEGQFYKQHHDYIPFHNERAQGVRILTVFLYLSDVEEGGGTHFNIQNITVKPKMGRAVIWPSVLDRDPNKKDFRTDHEALPVIKGVKYAANGMCLIQIPGSYLLSSLFSHIFFAIYVSFLNFSLHLRLCIHRFSLDPSGERYFESPAD